MSMKATYSLCLKVGEILFHKPRANHYKVIAPTKIKTSEGWVDGWIYQRVEYYEKSWHRQLDTDVYTRPTSMFDSDWTVVVPVL